MEVKFSGNMATLILCVSSVIGSTNVQGTACTPCYSYGRSTAASLLTNVGS